MPWSYKLNSVWEWNADIPKTPKLYFSKWALKTPNLISNPEIPKTLKSHFQNESWKYQTSSTKYREDTKSSPLLPKKLSRAKSGTLYFVQKVEPFTLYLPSPPHPKNSLLQKVVNSPESSVELFGFVVWFDQIDLPFRLNKN
jgi:hypothetical protein